MVELSGNTKNNIMFRAMELEKAFIIRFVIFFQDLRDKEKRQRIMMFAIIILIMALILYTLLFFVIIALILKYM